MSKEDENISHTSTFSEICSNFDRINFNSEKDLLKDNEKLKKQIAKLTEMNVNLSNQLQKANYQMQKKDEHIDRIEWFYTHEIKKLKQQMHFQNRDFSKHKKNHFRANNEENINPNMNFAHENYQKFLHTKRKDKFSVTDTQRHRQATQQKLEPKKTSIFDNAYSLYQKLSKLSLDQAFDKCNSMIQQLKDKNEIEDDEEFNNLKSKVNHLKETPLSINLLSEKEIVEMENTLSSIDVQIGILTNCRKKQF